MNDHSPGHARYAHGKRPAPDHSSSRRHDRGLDEAPRAACATASSSVSRAINEASLHNIHRNDKEEHR
jgi:hypothetical protein